MDERLDLWAATASELVWDEPYSAVHEPRPGHGRWFVGGRLNLATNLVDRHVATRADAPAFHWEGEPGDLRTVTYGELHREVLDLAGALAGLGLSAGDRVALYAGLLPESIITMLACGRLGATFCVLPAMLPADALAAMLADLQPKVLVTQDGAWRHGVVLPLKARADEALTAVSGIDHTIVIRRAGIDVAWYEGDRWLHDLVASRRPGATATTPPIASVEADAPALITYVANRRGRPVGAVHTAGRLLAYTRRMHTHGFGLGPDDVLWVPAEFTWIAAQTHGVLGPLAAGGTTLVYEGMLDTPTRERTWSMIERHRVHTLMVTPSVVRAVHRWAEAGPTPDQVASLRAILTAGEPLDEETRRWLHDDIGRGSLEVVNVWGQTELAGTAQIEPPLSKADWVPDAGLSVVDDEGRPVPAGEIGDLVLTHPWPGIAPRFHGDPGPGPGVDETRPGMFVTGDRARLGDDGHIELLGRSDRVMNISGQLVSALEIGDVLEEHPLVAQAVVVDRPNQRTGRAVVACVVPAAGVEPTIDFAADLRRHVHDLLGGLAQPQSVVFVDAFPELPVELLVAALESLCAGTPGVSHVAGEQIAAAAST